MQAEWLSMSPEQIRTLAVALFFVLVVLGLYVLAKSNNKKIQQQTEEEAEAIKRLQESGLYTPQGEPMCIICLKSRQENPATKYMPVSGKHWFDESFLFSWINRMWALPHKYVVDHKHELGPQLCEHHWNMAVDRLEEVFDGARSQHLQLKHDVSKSLKKLDEGGLQKYLEDTVEQMRQDIGIVTPGGKVTSFLLRKKTEPLTPEEPTKEKLTGVDAL